MQPSALVRFSQSMGYQGFSELQEVFQSRLRERVLNYDERIGQLREHTRNSGKAGLVFDGVVGAAEQSLGRLRERLDPAQLDAATDMLAGAETIYLIGLRRSFPISSYMAYAFGKLKVRSLLIGSPAGIDQETLSMAGSQDAAIAVSFSPYASATVDHARQLAGQGVPIVAITDSAFSPLAEYAKVWFEVAEADFSGFRSLSATMALAMALTVSVAGLRRLGETWPDHVWLNPVPRAHWGHTRSITMIREIFPERMQPLTLQGLTQAMRLLG